MRRPRTCFGLNFMRRIGRALALAALATLSAAALASFALAMLSVFEDIRNTRRGYPTLAIFNFLGLGGQIWENSEFTLEASVRNGSIDIFRASKRCLCGELRPHHARSCIKRGG